MANEPSGSSLNINCQRTAKIKINNIVCAAARGGEPAFNAYRDAHNAFVGTLSGLANTVVATIEPILTIDEFVVNTFVRPPLDATVKVLEDTTRTIKIPLQALGKLDTDPRCGKFHTGLRKGTDAVVKFLTKDYNKLSNIADNLDEWMGDRRELVEQLKALSEAVGSLEIEEDYNEFVNTKCQTT